MSLFINRKLDELQRLAKAMRADLAISDLERLETKYKSIIRLIANRSHGNPRTAFDIATIQKGLGLMFKYKPYGIKACTLLGYSIFLLNRGEGFSFQNHLSFKVELFRVLDVLPGGYLFAASQRSWKKVFEEKKFKNWLAGKGDDQYNRFRIFPAVGDILKINKIGIVHTAVGCILEEYANASTDMVPRLYDQNCNKEIPRRFSREFVERALGKIEFPEGGRLISVVPPHKKELIRSKKTKFGEITILNNTKAFSAACFRIGAGQTQNLLTKDKYVSIYVTSGEGVISIFDNREKRDKKLSFKIKKGETTLLIPKTAWRLENISRELLSYSFLSVNKVNALK